MASFAIGMGIMTQKNIFKTWQMKLIETKNPGQKSQQFLGRKFVGRSFGVMTK